LSRRSGLRSMLATTSRPARCSAARYKGVKVARGGRAEPGGGVLLLEQLGGAPRMKAVGPDHVVRVTFPTTDK
jgi:hypothetical protein